MSKVNRWIRCSMPIILGLVLALTLIPTYLLPANAQGGSDQGVETITGSVTVTNPFALQDSAEPFAALIDLTAFVHRDHDARLPFPDQVTASFQGDLAKEATYTMQLPVKPRVQLNEVGHTRGLGVGIFAIDYDTNSIGDPFMGPYEWRGWPNGLDSLQFDPGTYEVAAGNMVVWSPNDQESFPTDFGPDGKLFTDDDPVAPIGKGWTVVNVSKKPFQFVREQTVNVPILEGLAANNDLSKLTYTQAFDALVKDLQVRYTFNQFKHIDWNAIVSDIRPLVVKAEADKDKDAFNVAMMRFAARFKDGHLSVDTDEAYFAQQTDGGLGMVLGQADDGTVIARAVLDQMPASGAGIKVGATILQWNGKPIAQALADTELLFAIQSSPHAIRLQQLRYITRTPVGTKVTVQFQNPGEDPKIADLVSIKERQSFSLSSFNIGKKPQDMPIQIDVKTQGDLTFGYIKINTFFDDSVLLTRMWEWSLNKMQSLKVDGLILDMRQNGGGSGNLAIYFAGSFTKQSFILNKSFQADKNGKFLYTGSDVVDPAPIQWDGPVTVLIGPACASACEIFSAAMAHDPAHFIVGRYPTAGVEAGIEPWTLPDGLYFQAPTTQLQAPDGSIFLEGTGVIPNVKVPVTVQSLMSSDDQELPVAEQALAKAQPAATATPPAQ